MEKNNKLDENLPQFQIAKHLAARAVMALRSGFGVQRLSLGESEDTGSGIVCDWKSERASYKDDAKLVQRGFALIYIGTILDQKTPKVLSDALKKELNSDMSSALEAREAAVEWDLVDSIADTNPFAHAGYKMASRLLPLDGELIERSQAN